MPAWMPPDTMSADVSKAEEIRNRKRSNATVFVRLGGYGLDDIQMNPAAARAAMVQYSAPARPGMMRRTASEAPQSGQLDSAGVACSICSDWGIVMLRPPTSPTAA